MTKVVRIVILILLMAALVLVRYFEDSLFYNPLLKFFRTDHTTEVLPEMDRLKLYVNVAMRFAINTILSLGVLWVLFKNREVLRLSLFLYVVLFLVLMPVFILLINTSDAGSHMALFYVRRFLIQPLFLLILLPAFYFQKRSR